MYGNGFGGMNYGYGSNGFGSNKPSDQMKELGKSLVDIVWKKEDLTPFQKAFYKAHHHSSKRSIREIEEYREKKQIKVKSRHEVPFPFFTWEQTNFPPYIMEAIKIAGFKEPTPIQSQSIINKQ